MPHFPRVLLSSLSDSVNYAHAIVKVHFDESYSLAGGAVYNAEIYEFLGYPEKGAHLDRVPGYQRFHNPRPLDIVSGDATP